MKYNNSPLCEVVFELFFTTNSWNSVIPGLFYSNIREKFPETKQRSATNNGNTEEITLYINKESNMIIQLSRSMMSVNKLPKYNGWDNFSQYIDFALKALNKTFDILRINRIGLRYINRFDINKHSVENIKDFLYIHPNVPENLSNEASSIQMLIEYPQSGTNIPDVMTLNLSTIRPIDQMRAPLSFEINCINLSSNIINHEDIKKWLNESHNKINNTFDLCLTEKAKILFKKSND